MHAESAPSFGHMPTEFPAESAARIGRAILNRSFSLSLLGDLYDVIGFGLRQIVGDSKPTFGAAVDGELTHDQMAELLVKAGESKPTFAAGLNAADDGHDVAGAIPWATVVPMLLQLVLKIALGKKNKS